MKNILIIMTDQQRKDSLGCYGNPVCRTPNLDRLAAGGIRFERNYVANPICMPNRLSLFTGKTTRNHGLWTNGLNLTERETVAHHFARHGYQTASIGKIHFTPYGGAGGNRESMTLWKERDDAGEWFGPYWGYQHVELTLGHTAALAHYGKWFRDRGGTGDILKDVTDDSGLPPESRDLPEELHDSAFVADRACEFLRSGRDREKPFFLVASFPDPHHPFNPPARTAEQYSTEEVVMPVGGSDDLATRPGHYMQHFRGEWHRQGLRSAPAHPEGIPETLTRGRIRNTYAMVDLIDRNAGRILDTLESEGLRDDTVVVFTSDHGELLGDHGLWLKGPFFYEGLINTPLIVSDPSRLRPGVSNALFSDLDLVPTLCEMAGLPVMPFVDGVSQLPHLLGEAGGVRDRCLIEYRNGYGAKDCSSKALVTADHKYVRYQTGEEELTDLANDPTESRNVAGEADYREVRDRLREELLDEVLRTEQKGPEQITHA